MPRSVKYAFLILLLLAWLSPAQAAPYEFTSQLDYYTWGETLTQVKETLGEPYSQDPGGVAYLMDSNWIKQVLTHEGKVYQVIERIIYAQADPAADKEYAAIKQKLTEMFGPPSEEDVACPNPQPSTQCRITRWDGHPVTQVFLAQSEEKIISIMLGLTSRELRGQAQANPQNQGTLSVGQIIGAYQQNPNAAAQKYGGQRLKVMGIAAGQTKDAQGQLCLRVSNAFNHKQQLLCYYASNFNANAWLPPEGSLLVTGVVGEYRAGVLEMRDCEIISAPSE